MIPDAPIHLLPAEGGFAFYVAAWIFTGVIFAITALILFFQYYTEGRRRSKKPVKEIAKPEEAPAEQEIPSEEKTEEAPIPEEPTPDETKES